MKPLKRKIHWEPMFQTFKAEVAADSKHRLLTIETYIRFLDEIEKYVPIVELDSSKSSTVCTVM